MDRDSLSQQDCDALIKTAYFYLGELRNANPNWTFEDLINWLHLPNSKVLREIFNQVGIRGASSGFTKMNEMLTLRAKGVWCDEVIAEETGASIEYVKAVSGACVAGFGKSPFGIGNFGRNRGLSDGKSFVLRRVSKAGQLSYKGRLYTLGASYRGRIAMIRAEAMRLVVIFGDRPAVIL